MLSYDSTAGAARRWRRLLLLLRSDTPWNRNDWEAIIMIVIMTMTTTRRLGHALTELLHQWVAVPHLCRPGRLPESLQVALSAAASEAGRMLAKLDFFIGKV